MDSKILLLSLNEHNRTTIMCYEFQKSNYIGIAWFKIKRETRIKDRGFVDK